MIGQTQFLAILCHFSIVDWYDSMSLILSSFTSVLPKTQYVSSFTSMILSIETEDLPQRRPT